MHSYIGRKHVYIYRMYMYLYVYVCVCMCVYICVCICKGRIEDKKSVFSAALFPLSPSVLVAHLLGPSLQTIGRGVTYRTHTHAHTYTHTHTHLQIHAHTCKHLDTNRRIYIHSYIWTYKHRYMHTVVYIKHVHTWIISMHIPCIFQHELKTTVGGVYARL